MPRETKGPCTITGIRLPNDVYAKLQEMANHTHTTKGAIVEAALRKYLDAYLEQVLKLDL